LLPDAYKFQRKGYVTGAVESNRRYVSDVLEVDAGVEDNLLGLLLDPQTSGGLLIAVPSAKQQEIEKALDNQGASGVSIGHVVSEGMPKLHVK
jgi:selenide,water dikinase